MNAVTSIDAEEFEYRAVAGFCAAILTNWEASSPVLREQTRSTASANGYAFESVRRYGRPPETVLVLYFRDITRCQFLFGWRFAFWRYRYWPQSDEMQRGLAQEDPFGAMPQSVKDDPEKYGRWLAAVEFLDTRDCDEATEPEYLPISENCNPDGVTWLASAEDPEEDHPRPWLDPAEASRFVARGDGG